MKRLIATATLATLVASPAFAQSYQYNPAEGPYLGAGLGYSQLDNDTLDWLSDLGANTDDSDTAYQLFAGYQFNPHFAVEAGYVEFGDFSANAAMPDYSAKAEVSAEGFTAALVGKLPIQNGFSVHGKLGMIAWNGDYKESDSDGWSYSESTDGSDPFYGIGAEYVVNQVMMRAEYERYDLSDSGDDFAIDLVSASLGYRF